MANMIKFSFNKTAAKKKPVVFNLEQVSSDKEHAESKKTEFRSRSKSEKRKQDLEAPFALMTGDPSYHPENNPDVEKPGMEIIHKSVPKYSGLNKKGQPYATTMKNLLRGSDKWERIFIDKSQYAHNDEISKLAPHGLEAYRQKRYDANVSSSMLKTLHANDQARINKNNGVVPSTGGKALEPDDPINLINSYGGKSAIHKMLGFHIPYKMGHDLCVCGESSDKHVDAATAADHFNKTGEHLEIHKHLPQFVGSEPGNEVRASQSRQLSVIMPVEQSPGIFKNKKARADTQIGLHGDHIPMVRVANKGIKYQRYFNFEELRNGKRSSIQNVIKGLGSRYKKCVCSDGVLNPNQRDNSKQCEDCMPGKINHKIERDNDGNQILKPHTIGLGGGRQRYLNEADAPPCPHCKGEGELEINDKANNTKIACSKCEGSGKDKTSLSNSGFSCTNCGSDHSSQALTPENHCKICEGKGYVKNEIKPRIEKIKTVGPATTLEGNPRFLEPFGNNAPSNTGVDGWKGHGDKNCTRCKGDDEYQTEFGMPCNCRIASLDDDHISHSGKRNIHPDHVDLPEFYYQNHMANAYKDNTAANPHELHDHPNFPDPETGKTPFEQYGIGAHQEWANKKEGVPSSMYLGVWQHGKRLPQKTLDELNKKSDKHWSSKNAKYCAASADLEEINHVFSNFKSLPDNLPTVAPKKRLNRKDKRSRINLDDYHPAVQEIIPHVEQIIHSLPDSDTGKYNEIKDELYHAGSKAAEGDPSSIDHFREAYNGLLGHVQKTHGTEKYNELREALSSFPTIKINKEKEPTSSEVETNA